MTSSTDPSTTSNLRRIDAAIEDAGQLRETIAEQGGTWDGPQRELIANEFHRLVDSIVEGELLDNAAVRSLSLPSEVIRRWVEDQGMPDTTLILALDGIERALRSRERVLAAAAAAPGAPSHDAPPTAAFTPNEAALLATLTEKFYSAWPFKVAVGMLLVAALFAIGGTFLIGQQTYNVRHDLNQSADRAKEEIADRQRSTVDDLDRRWRDTTETMKELRSTADGATETIVRLHDSTASAMTSAVVEINRGRDDFAKKIDDGQKELKAMVDDFKSYSIELKERAVAQAVAAVRASLKEQESGIKEEILTPLEQIRDKDIADLRKIIESVSADVGQVRHAAKNQQDDLNALGPALNQLRSLAGQYAQIAQTVESIKSGESAAREAMTKASDHARRAAEYEQSARDASTPVFLALIKVRDEVEAHQRLLGEIDSQFRTLKNGVASLEKDAAQEKARIDKVKQVLGDVDQAQAVMSNLRERLAGLDPEVNAVRTRSEKAAVVLDRAEPTLWHIAKAEETSRSIVERLGALQAAMDKLKPDIEAVSGSVEPAKKSIVEFGRVEEDVKKVRHRLDQLQPGIEMLAERVQKYLQISKPPRSKSEAELTWDEWKVIQQALAMLGHDPGPADGKPGKRTRRAIQNYQKSRGEQQSDRLTPDQIPLLLKSPADRKETTVLVH